MEVQNETKTTGFILLGLSSHPEHQTLLFVLFLLIYLMTFLGNAGLILLTWKDSQLHTPMYFFLSNLSFVDLCYSSAIVPQMLATFMTGRTAISFLGCATQFYTFTAFVITELYILGVMAYDRYVAICHPLHYSSRMSPRSCILMVALPYVYGFSDSLIQTSLTFSFSFCGSRVINHFFCCDPPLFKLSCSDITRKQTILFLSVSFNLTSTFLLILTSYVYIISAILRLRSAEARRKTFSTCSSHFTVVLIFYGTLFFMYLRPSSEHSLDQDKIVAVFYTVVIPMINPLIYSLRNRDVKEALKKLIYTKQ